MSGRNDSPDLKKYLRQELQYQKATHSRDSQERPELYKINALSVEQMHEKLAILLSSDIQDSGVELFNTEEEILEILCKRQKDQESQTKSKEVIFQSQQPLAVVWDEGQERKW